jgi:hypothetical protein
VPRHVARLVTRLVAPLFVDYSASRRLVIDYSASRRLLVDYSASRRLVVDYSASRSLVVDYYASRRLVVDHYASRRLVVDYFAYAARPGASARRAAHHLSSTTSPPPRVRVPRHVARLVTRLIALLVVDYSASCRLVVDYFSSAARTGASTRRVARHAARCAARRRLLRLA